MEEHKVFDKFNTLYQDDKVQNIIDQIGATPEAPATPAPMAEPPKQEGGPAAMGDVGGALKNIEDFGQVPGVTDAIRGAREATKPTPEDINTFKTGSTMDKLKALPGGIAKSVGMAASNAIPSTVGEAGLMGAAGKILKGVGGGIRAMGRAFRGGTEAVAQPSTLNIGLNVGEKTSLNLDQVKAAIEDVGGKVKAIKQHDSASEPTAVVQLHKPLTPEQAHTVSENLNQEAIAQMTGDKGELYGPKAEAWKPFNPEYFVKPDGKFASEPKISDVKTGIQMRSVGDSKVAPEEYGGVKPLEQPQDLPTETTLKSLVEAERKTQGSRIVTPNDVSRAIGRDLLPDEEAALNHEKMGDYASHVFGLAEQATAVKNKVLDEISKFRGGMLESEDQIKYFFENYISIAAKMENTLEESARALQAGGQADVKIITKQAELLKMQQEQAESFQPGTPLTGTQIARLVDTLGLGRATQAIKNADRLGWDMITSHIYFSELSNPRTWQVNTGVSSFIMPLIQSASIGIGSRLAPKNLSKTAIEAGQMANYAPGAAEAHLVGAMDGFMTAVRHIKNSWDGGGIRGLFTDLRNLSPLPYSFAESGPAINTGPTISVDNLNRFFANHEKLSWAQFDPHGIMKPMAQLLDAYGEGAHFTRQIMEAGDRMSYLINEHAHRASQAYSRAVQNGLEGDDLVKYYHEQIANPTALIQRAANENAMHDIFREQIQGGMGGIVKGLGHPAFRPIVTYVRTPVNIASVGLEGWPGLNKLVGHIRADYEAGGAREQLARGRWMVGSTVTAIGAAMAVGDRFTGYGPLDPQSRQAWLTTHEPFAIRIRDTGDNKRDWVSLKYIQPISTWMGAAADFVQMKAWEEQPEKMAEYMWAPTVAFAHAISNTVFTNDLFNFLDTIQIKPHQNSEQWARAMEMYVENKAKNILSPFPSAAGKVISSIYDPVSKEVRGVADAIKSTIPGWSSTLPPRLDYFGDVQKYSPAYTMLMTPMRTTDTKYDKVTNDIAKNAPQLLTLPNIVDKTELTSQDLYDFKRIRGQEVKLFGGKKFGDALLDLVEGKGPAGAEYTKGTEGPHGMRSKLLSSYVAAYTKVAILKMAEKDPRFYNLAQEFENIESLTGKKVERPNFLKVQPQ